MCALQDAIDVTSRSTELIDEIWSPCHQTSGTSTPPAWVEKGVPLAQVRDLLGHASITTTERYDSQKLENLQLAAAKLESDKTFDAPARASVSPSNCQDFVKNSADRGDEGGGDPETQSEDSG